MNRVKIVLALLLLAVACFGQTKKRAVITKQDSLIAKMAGKKTIVIFQEIPDTLLVKMSTDQIIDSMTIGKRAAKLWLGNAALFSLDEKTFASRIFLQNSTYEVLDRKDFTSAFLQKYQQLERLEGKDGADCTSVPLDLMLTYKFIFDRFDERQKLALIEAFAKRYENYETKAANLLIAAIKSFAFDQVTRNSTPNTSTHKDRVLVLEQLKRSYREAIDEK